MTDAGLQLRTPEETVQVRLPVVTHPGGSTWQSVWLNGETVAIAESAGLDSPINRHLVDLSGLPPAVPGSLPASSLLR